jgi:hypothetical protein
MVLNSSWALRSSLLVRQAKAISVLLNDSIWLFGFGVNKV